MQCMEGMSEHDCGITPVAASDIAPAIVAAGVDLSCISGADSIFKISPGMMDIAYIWRIFVD